MQLGFGAGLQSYVELLAVAHYLLHHFAYLVHLDRVDDIVFGLIVIILCGLFETPRDLFHAVVQNVRETQQHRGGDVAHLQFVHHFFQVHLGISLARSHGHVAFVVDGEIFQSPACNVV